MSTETVSAPQTDLIRLNVEAVFRGIGQVFFQESVVAGICFVIGLAISSPLMAVGAVVGSVMGVVTARVLKYKDAEITAGLYGFNSTLVGIATFFFFQPGAVSVLLMLVGCIVATVLTQLMRHHVPFPTYTTPFIVTTWGVYFIGKALGAAPVAPGGPLESVGVIAAVAHGIGQVMFQANIWTGILFLVGIAVSDKQHAAWVLVASFLGMLVASYHATAGSSAIHIETLIEHVHSQNVSLGLYGYNATLTAVALYLWRKSLIPPLLGIIVSVPVTEMIPNLGLPALTAPFVLTTWMIMACGCVEQRLFKVVAPAAATPSIG